ncbi:TIGR03032 family protein [Vibrio sp. 10N.261.46.E12]|uniref:TIGR03032 family protein n=1 Tax=unclassified Vibrio TaxID=2614977 RepID=UPI000976E0A2|nr:MULTISPECIES: TIGR03032 family protein [unclassified Vibrio]OMO36254.1 TIGR03032 family protein [Vibrio sp. 10N.261.45.E1]PMJ34576.1 TIGR03032 family protein [Vibrio sp. 10N.286.45.B6]PML88134.1 TIGR03032 family protein [Vibrio sp. 10N.261.49.E11]PMM67366.1 TIGR03032 family protein [Vibrio sp. 10N.261.46.F12]PMM81868.1 TIGR03032 family protein [Vibrio sp. 10N.261.46.E8]
MSKGTCLLGLKSFGTRYTANLPEILTQLNITIMLSSYQSEKVIMLRTDGEELDIVYKNFPRPMGIAANEGKLVLGSFNQLINFHRDDELLDMLKKPLQTIDEDITAPTLLSSISKPAKTIGKRNAKFQPVDERVDACFIARSTHLTGMLNTHDLVIRENTLWGVSSSFSCICTFDPEFSFSPYWIPPFISAVKPEDRCHLNGLAMKGDKPGFVTTFSTTDSAAQWREQSCVNSGTIIDVENNELLVDGLFMPHSPRYHQDKVYYCDSGFGWLSSIDPGTGTNDIIAELPGFTRGLDIVGNLAFVGTSQIRASNIKHPAQRSRFDKTVSGVSVINIETGETVGQIEFKNGLEQIYDIKLIPNTTFPELIEPSHPRMRNHFVHPKHCKSKE